MAPSLQVPSPERIRDALIRRRARIARAWMTSLGDRGDTLVLVPAGLVQAVQGSDQHYGYRVHDDHYYLSGCREPGQILAFDAAGDEQDPWTLFGVLPSQEDRVWHGSGATLEDLGARSGLKRVRAIDSLEDWLMARAGRPVARLGHPDLLDRPAAYALHAETLRRLAFDEPSSARLEGALVDARLCKDDVEVSFMRAAAAATRAGHLHGMKGARLGMTERDLQVEIDFAFQRAGADRSAYPTIAAAGENASVLHATPSRRRLAGGDLVLVDAGAEVLSYDCDVTRTWPVDAKFSGAQRAIYDIVLDVQEAAIRGARPGVEYLDLHRAACLGIAAGLADLGLLRGSPEDLVAQDAHALFFPHGLGHLIGLATHDVGGYLAGRVPSERPGWKFLRMDRPLEVGAVITIEPGIYFIPALLEDPELRDQHRDSVNWARAGSMLGLGGVRIEDDVLIGEDAPEVLTAAIPKQVEDIEALRV